MFGLLKRRSAEEALVLTAQIQIGFDLLQKNCPGTAYMFARTLFNSNGLLDLDISRKQKSKIIDEEINTAPGVSGATTGVVIYALRFIKLLVEEKNTAAMLTYSCLLYTSPSPRDRS